METKMTIYYIAVYQTTGRPVIEGGQVPVFWYKKNAREHFKNWTGVRFVRCTIDIWPS